MLLRQSGISITDPDFFTPFQPWGAGPTPIAQPRQGRNTVAQGETPGKNGPHPLLFPLPRLAGEGAGGGGRAHHPRLSPWARLCRPPCGLTSLTNF
jgi:hypothetical protein